MKPNNPFQFRAAALLAAFGLAAVCARPAGAAALIRAYEFNGNLNDQLGGPALVPLNGVINPADYTFSTASAVGGEGLSLTNWTSTPNDAGNYTLDLSFKFTAPSPSTYMKVIDMLNRTSDTGVYQVNANAADFYIQNGADIQGPPGGFPLNEWVRLVLTRDGTTKDLKVYVNGLEQLSLNDATDEAVFAATDNIINLFNDDPVGIGNEGGVGSINQFRIYSGAMTAEEVLALGGPKPPPLRIGSLTFSDFRDQVTLTWASQPGKTYAVEASTALPAWTDVAFAVPSGGDTTTYMQDLFSVGGGVLPDTIFFRVREE